MIGTTAALITAAAIGAGGSVASGVIGSRAAKSAAETQADAAAGVAQRATETGERAATDVTQAGEYADTRVTEAARQAGAGMWLSADDANALLRSIYGNAVEGLEPYTTTGANAIRTLNAATGPEGEFNRTFTGADLANEPGYQFRLAEGAKALERSAAARGTLLGGRGLKEMERYSQGYASDEYQNAFNRFEAGQTRRYNQLYNLAGIGQRATEVGIGAGETYGGRAATNIMRAGEYEGNVNTDAAAKAGQFRLSSVGNAGQFRMQGQEIAGNATMGGANATAAGQIGAANAWSNTLSGIGRTAMDLAYLNAPARNPYNPNPLPTGSVVAPGMPPGTIFNPNTGRWENPRTGNAMNPKTGTWEPIDGTPV